MIAQASPAAGPLQTDPSKRVNYTLGLVLGVDEFQQDQLYHAAGRRGHNRLLHGYGTVSGLAVGPVTQGADPEIQVEAGVAVDPAGREIRIPDRMCVKVNRWLDRHQAALRELYGNTPLRPIPVAVVLCHRECPTDTVPVPGEPCRSQDDAMQPSRIRESFELKLMLRDDAPWNAPLRVNPHGLDVYRLHHPEEQAVRAFGELLARVQSTTDPLLDDHGRGELLRGVRALATAADERELASPPPATDDPILLPAATAPDILREAFRVWVTEVRPAIRGQEDPGACNEDQCCVLLAEYDLPVTPLWAVQAGNTPQTAVRPMEDRRPYLLHTRLLQEWLIATGGEEGRPDVDSWATLQILGPKRIRMWVHHDEWLDVPRDAITVVLNDVPLPPERISTMVWADVRNVWDVVLTNEMRDGDVVEIRFNTELIELVEAPPEPEPPLVKAEVRGHVPRLRVKDAIARVVDDAAERLGRAGDDAEAAGARESGGETGEETGDDVEAAAARGPGEETDEEMGEDDDLPGDNGYGEWTPTGAARLQPVQSVADELRGPSGEYLDRYGWTLSAFIVYNRLQGGDLAGEYKLPIVARIQRTPVSTTRPSNPEHYLRFNGSQWAPAFLDDGEKDLAGRYPRSTVAALQGKTLTAPNPQLHQVLTFNGAAWVPAPVAFDPAVSDLKGDAPNTTIAKLQGKTLTAPNPLQHEVLTFNGTAWVPAAVAFSAEGSDLEGAAPNTRIARLQGNTVTAANPEQHQVLTFNGRAWVPAAVAFDPAESDLTGDAPNTTIAKLQGNTVTAGDPEQHQVLTFDGRAWVPAAVAFDAEESDLTGDAPNTTIAKLQGNPVAAESPNRGELLAFDGTSWVPGTVGFSEDSDLTGDAPDTTIAKLQGHPLAAQGPEPGQFLSYDGTSWVPAAVEFSQDSDLTGSAPTTSIARLQGNAVNAQNPDNGQVLSYDGTAWVPAAVSFSAASDLAGDAPDTTIARLQGQTVDAATPAANQVLTYNGSAWVPADPASGGGSGGAPTGPATGDLSGTYPAPTIARLQNRPLNAANPAANQVLTFNGTAWVAANPPAGGGAPSGGAGGDLAGTYPAPTVGKLQGRTLNAAQPAQGQFLMYNGTAWVAAAIPVPPAPPEPAYQTVAAGIFRVEFTGGTPFATAQSNVVGDLALTWMQGTRWRLDFTSFDPNQFVYVVKGLASEGVVNVVDFASDPLIVEFAFSFERFNAGTVHLEISAYKRLVFRPQVDESFAGTRTASLAPAGTVTGGTAEKATGAAPVETTKTTPTRTTRKR